jgi:hypothetical protein
MLLVKTDGYGNQSWRRTFDIIASDFAGGIQQTSDGGYIIDGSTQDDSPGALTRIYLVKTDVSGNLQWQKVIGNDSYHFSCEGIQQTTDGGYILSGTAYCWPSGETDVFLVRIAAETQPHATISGTVSPAFAGLTINLLSPTNQLIATTTTDENGEFTFSNVVPACYFVDLVAPAGYEVDANHLPVTVLSGQQAQVEFTMTLLPGIVEGHVAPAYAGITISITDNTQFYASMPTDNDGFYHFENLTGNTNYVVELVLPLDFLMASENPVNRNVVGGTTETVDFAIESLPAANDARSKGYWKHQVKVNVTGNGNAECTEQQLIALGVEIFQHFYGSQAAPILIPGVTHKVDGSASAMTLTDMNTTFSNNLPGTSVYKQACQQFLALLLNVVSGKLGQTIQASQDGATVAQTIYFIDQIFTSSTEIAKNIAETLNEGQMVAGGVIPGGLPNIIYGEESCMALQVTEFRLIGPIPNPFNTTTVFRIQLPVPGQVALRVFDMSGRLVNSLVDGWSDAGVYEATLEGTHLASGVYVYRLSAGEFSAQGKMVLMK